MKQAKQDCSEQNRRFLIKIRVMRRKTSIAVAITVAISTVGVSSPASAIYLQDVVSLAKRQINLESKNTDLGQQAQSCIPIPLPPFWHCN